MDRNNGGRFGGNGGLSLRRVSKIVEVLRFQQPYRGEFHEEQWLAARIGLLPGAHMASPEVERDFSVESMWSERPMGFHLDPNGFQGEVWDNLERRKAIYEYCPEIKLILDMRLERERCPIPYQSLEPIETTPPEGDGQPNGIIDHNGQPINPDYYLPATLGDVPPAEAVPNTAEVATFRQYDQPGTGMELPGSESLEDKNLQQNSAKADANAFATGVEAPQDTLSTIEPSPTSSDVEDPRTTPEATETSPDPTTVEITSQTVQETVAEET